MMVERTNPSVGACRMDGRTDGREGPTDTNSYGANASQQYSFVYGSYHVHVNDRFTKYHGGYIFLMVSPLISEAVYVGQTGNHMQEAIYNKIFHV